MTGLTLNTQYQYQIQGNTTVIPFYNQRQRTNGRVYAIYADFGALAVRL